MKPNVYVIGYVVPCKEGDDDNYPCSYDVFVVAASLKDAIDSADLYKASPSDIVHSVMHTSKPPVSYLRFTCAVRSHLSHPEKQAEPPK